MLIKSSKICFYSGNTLLLDSVDLQIDAGEIVTVIGPNGAGKTTLLKLLMGIEKPSSGSVERKPNLRIGYMPQQLHLPKDLPMTTLDFLQLTGRNTSDIKAAMAQTGVGDILQHPLQKISGGEMQRTLLARAMLNRPELLVLDEPAQGVDLTGQDDMYRLISNIRHLTGCAVLMVSHDLHLVMANTDRVLCLNQHICCHGHPEQVSNDPAFRDLFGELPGLALYTHHHDHHHDLHGHVVNDDEEQGGGHCNHEGCDHA